MADAKKFHYAWVILIAVSLIRGVSGPALNASSGVFLTPVSNELGIGIGQLSLYLSISSIATLFWLPIAGNLFNKFNVRTIVTCGVLLQTAAFILLGFMNSVWGWYIMAVPLAMGAVLLVNLLGPVLIGRWFAKNVGMVMGLMMMITSLLGAVFQPVFTTLISDRGWRFTYVAFGIFALIFMLVIGYFFLKNKPGDKRLQPFGAEEIRQDGNTVNEQVKSGVSAGRAVKSIAFYGLLLYMVVLTGFAAFHQHITTFGLGLGFGMSTIGNALAISMIGSAVGSVLIGIFSDRQGILPTSAAVLIIGFVAVILFSVSGSSFLIFAVATFLHGLATSAIGVVAPLLTTKFFGNLEYEKLFSLVMIGSPLASIVLMPLYGFIYDRFGSYRIVFLFLLGALAIAAFGLFAGHAGSKRLQK